ncbi:MAG: DUF2336 domain-containing protein [Pseudomonadota bacterium]
MPADPPEIEPTPARRRRENVLPVAAIAKETKDEERLSQDDVALLRADPTAEARALVARKLGEQVEGLVEEGHADLVNEIFNMLVKDVEAEVRRSLADAMASSPNLPISAAKTLAHDTIEIAQPILQSSPVLNDADLIEIVRTSAIQYSLAVAARENVSEDVSEALVETGHKSVVNTLLENETAQIGEGTYQRVLSDFGADTEVQQRLVKRLDLPGTVVERLTAKIGESLESSLVEERGIDAETAKELLRTATQNATITRTTRGTEQTRLRQYLRAEYACGDLDHKRVLTFLRSGDIQSFETSMSILAGVEFKQTLRMLYHENRRHLMALCVAAEFSAQEYLKLQLAINAAVKAVNNKGARKRYTSAGRSELLRQYEVVAADRDAVRAMVAAPSV